MTKVIELYGSPSPNSCPKASDTSVSCMKQHLRDRNQQRLSLSGCPLPMKLFNKLFCRNKYSRYLCTKFMKQEINVSRFVYLNKFYIKQNNKAASTEHIFLHSIFCPKESILCIKNSICKAKFDLFYVLQSQQLYTSYKQNNFHKISVDYYLFSLMIALFIIQSRLCVE